MTQAIVYPDGRLTLTGRTFRAALGRSGVRADKQEGDGATPAGPLPLRRVLYRADRVPPPACALPIEPLAPDDGWCDDAADTAYNRRVRLPYAGSHEELWRTDALYDLIGVLGWNDTPAERGRGSAIFLHIAGRILPRRKAASPLPNLDTVNLEAVDRGRESGKFRATWHHGVVGRGEAAARRRAAKWRSAIGAAVAVKRHPRP